MKLLPNLSTLRCAAAALLLGLLAPSCLISKDTINQPLQAVELDGLIPGETSAAEVAAKLGAPNEVVQLGLRSAWRYDFAAAKRAGFTLIVITFSNVDTRQDRIWVFFDEEGVLSYYGTTFEAENSRYAMPWQKVKVGGDQDDADADDDDADAEDDD